MFREFAFHIGTAMRIRMARTDSATISSIMEYPRTRQAGARDARRKRRWPAIGCNDHLDDGFAAGGKLA